MSNLSRHLCELYLLPCRFLFFFFQAEDGIRDLTVTGVQTCALPIWARRPGPGRSCAWPLRRRRAPRARTDGETTGSRRRPSRDRGASPPALRAAPASWRRCPDTPGAWALAGGVADKHGRIASLIQIS